VCKTVSETVGKPFWLEVPVDMYNTACRVYTFTSFHCGCGCECSPGMGRDNAQVNFRKGPSGNQPENLDMQQEEPNSSWSQRRAGKESCCPYCIWGQLMGAQFCSVGVTVLQQAQQSSWTICSTWEKNMVGVRHSTALPLRSWAFSVFADTSYSHVGLCLPCDNYCIEILIT